MEDNDFKYIMQDTGNFFLGARYSYQELLDHEMVPFKLKAVITHYLLKETDVTNTLESTFYYIEDQGFLCETYKQLKVKIKVQLLVEKKSVFGKKHTEYREQTLNLKELLSMNLAQRKSRGLIVREIIFPKLALMTFSI